MLVACLLRIVFVSVRRSRLFLGWVFAEIPFRECGFFPIPAFPALGFLEVQAECEGWGVVCEFGMLVGTVVGGG